MSSEAPNVIAPRRERPYRTVTTQKMIIAALLVAGAGIGLLYIGGRDTGYWKHHSGLQALTEHLGAVLIISVGLAVLWELMGKRAFAREVLEAAGAASDVDAAGISRIGVDYNEDPRWDELFNGAVELDVFVAYGQTWRNNHLGRLKKMAANRRAHIRVFLADPDDEPTMQSLTHRFNMTVESLRRKIDETRDSYEKFRETGGAKIETFYYAGDRFFAFYRFDEKAVVTLYQHRPERSDKILNFVCVKGGSYFDVIESEIESIAERSKPAFPLD
jgi:hypothetical protein